MTSKTTKLLLTAFGSIAAIFLFPNGYMVWGILALTVALFSLLFYFQHEYLYAGVYYIRKGKLDKALEFLHKIKNPEQDILKERQGYYYLLVGICEAKRNLLQAEDYFRRALSLGLKSDAYMAAAKLSLAEIAAAKKNKPEALDLINEVKQFDKKNKLRDQIKLIEGSL